MTAEVLWSDANVSTSVSRDSSDSRVIVKQTGVAGDRLIYIEEPAWPVLLAALTGRDAVNEKIEPGLIVVMIVMRFGGRAADPYDAIAEFLRLSGVVHQSDYWTGDR